VSWIAELAMILMLQRTRNSSKMSLILLLLGGHARTAISSLNKNAKGIEDSVKER
jgi:hypothetical protein